VTVVVEGNPEIYDFPECLSTVNRSFELMPTTPYVVRACEMLERKLGVQILGNDYVLTSGFNQRQGITTEELVGDLRAFVATSTTIAVMELYAGDLEAAIRAIQPFANSVYVFMLTNMFTPEQEVHLLGSLQDCESYAQWMRRRFTTFIVLSRSRAGMDLGTDNKQLLI
jgi:hypothetical protein